ncbi:hypothetical protein FJY71_07715, partial [candidate division WOR-3 bacterium]|nr:hypothetical protein [candidate division WOR-3 bacterium]
MKRALVLGLLAAALSGQESLPRREVVVARRPARIGLALSGGAALGFAHIGVLKVLEREGIPVVAISGNSMGSMVGGVYAAGYGAAEMESIAVNADWSLLFSSRVPFGAQFLPERQQARRYFLQLRHRNLFPSVPGGLVPLQNVEFLLNGLLSEVEYNTGYDFDSLPIPYRAVAVDLVSGEKQVLRRGRLEQAIRASIAIPAVFAPEELGTMSLVDGGVQQYLPVDPLLEFDPDLIVAVLTMKHNEESGISLIDVISRSMDLVAVDDLRRQKALADVLIEPNVDPFAHSDFARAGELVAAGESAATAALPRIRELLAGRRPAGYRRAVRPRPLSLVRQVRFEGAEVTRGAVLRREMDTRPGRYLRFDDLSDDLLRLFSTGLFEDVNYRLEFGRQESVDVVVELKERAFGFYSLGLRYDNTDDVVLGFEVGQGNLSGSGAGVRLAAVLGNPNEIRAGLTGTRLFRLPVGYRVDGFWGEAERQYHGAGRWLGTYAAARRGGIAEAGYIIGRHAFFNVGLLACFGSNRFPAGAAFDTLPRREWVVGPRFFTEFNNQADVDLPVAGRSLSFEAVYSSPLLNATREFLRLDLRTERVLPVLGRAILARPGFDAGAAFG